MFPNVSTLTRFPTDLLKHSQWLPDNLHDVSLCGLSWGENPIIYITIYQVVWQNFKGISWKREKQFMEERHFVFSFCFHCLYFLQCHFFVNCVTQSTWCYLWHFPLPKKVFLTNSSCSKPVWLSFSCTTQNRIFWKRWLPNCFGDHFFPFWGKTKKTGKLKIYIYTNWLY